MTRQFFEDSGPQGHFFEENKKFVLDKVFESMCTQMSGLCRFSFFVLVSLNLLKNP